MFGTLHLSPSETGPVYVEKADGATFAARECHVPHHAACDQCRLKKLRCNGGKPRCNRCSTTSAICAYSEMNPGANRRVRESRRTVTRNGVRNADVPVPRRAETGSVQTVLSDSQGGTNDESNMQSLQRLGHGVVSPQATSNGIDLDVTSATRPDGFLSMDVDSSNVADFQRKSSPLTILLSRLSPSPAANLAKHVSRSLVKPRLAGSKLSLVAVQ